MAGVSKTINHKPQIINKKPQTQNLKPETRNLKPLSFKMTVNKQPVNALVFISITDGHCKKVCYTQYFYFGSRLFNRNGIANNEFLKHTVFDVFISIAA